MIAGFVNEGLDKDFLNIAYQSTIDEFYLFPIIEDDLEDDTKDHINNTFINNLENSCITYLKNKYENITMTINKPFINKPFMRYVVNKYLENYTPPDLTDLYKHNRAGFIKSATFTDKALLDDIGPTMQTIIDDNKYLRWQYNPHIEAVFGKERLKYIDIVKDQFIDVDHLAFEVMRIIDLEKKNINIDKLYDSSPTLIKGGGEGSLLTYILLAILIILVVYMVYVVFKHTYVRTYKNRLCTYKSIE